MSEFEVSLAEEILEVAESIIAQHNADGFYNSETFSSWGVLVTMKGVSPEEIIKAFNSFKLNY